MKRHDVSLEVWSHTYHDVLGLVVDVAAFDKCRACQSSWVDIAEDLAVVCSTKLGNAIFGKALVSLKYGEATAMIAKFIDAMLASVLINMDVVKELRKQFATDLAAMDEDAYASFPKKYAKVSYKGIDLEMPVSSLIEHFNCCIFAKIREVAMDLGYVGGMLCENDLVPLQGLYKTVAMDQDMVKDIAAARSVATAFFDGIEPCNGETVMKILAGKRSITSSIDPTFKIEETFFAAMQGDHGAKHAHARMMTCLPSALETKTVAQSLQALENLAKTELFTFVGLGVLGQYNTIKQWLSAMKNNWPPQFAAVLTGDFMQAVRLRMADFCIRLSSGASTDLPLRGKDAIAAIFKDVGQKHATPNTTLDLADLRPLQIFSWLLEETEKTTTDAWTAEVMQSTLKSKGFKKDDDELNAKKAKTTGKGPKHSTETLVDGYFN